ncbi:hypothetical protein PtA15_18A383 [Puccinia triticina]|uniref:Uncharacterized protein n=2 Tax=Puccinia triticina TaxID=208348 RepID=A0ABY7D6P1_9BASI|nr:uncharacterized protein PtA15_18A383 [Puccinia triticina]WAQ93323.1 hypothetical protein PtA15_18A383 [Puccinia triticina]WAR63318.1 hypothetical protein PtB15_18B401 [Puccinia triticina]
MFLWTKRASVLNELVVLVSFNLISVTLQAPPFSPMSLPATMGLANPAVEIGTKLSRKPSLNPSEFEAIEMTSAPAANSKSNSLLNPSKTPTSGPVVPSDKLELLKYMSSFHKLPNSVSPETNLAKGEKTEDQIIQLARLNTQRKDIIKQAGLILKHRRQRTMAKFAVRLEEIAQSIELAKRVLRHPHADADGLVDWNTGLSRLDEVVKKAKSLHQQKIKAQLSAPPKASSRIFEPIGRDPSDAVLENLQRTLTDGLENLLKLAKKHEDTVDAKLQGQLRVAKKYEDKDGAKLQGHLNDYRNTIFLVLNSVREFGLVNKDSLARLLSDSDTLKMLAKSDVRTVVSGKSRADSAQLTSLKAAWRKSLDELIRASPSGDYGSFYVQEEARSVDLVRIEYWEIVHDLLMNHAHPA